MSYSEMGMNSFNNSENPRKRNRLTLSCNYCKKRKVKCNRERPCSSCVKYNVGDLCLYPEPPWSEPNVIEENAAKLGVKPSFSVAQNHSNHRTSSSTIKPPRLQRYDGNNVHIARKQAPMASEPPQNTGGVISELELLKMKIKQIENSMLNGREYGLTSSQASTGLGVPEHLGPHPASNHIAAPSPSPFQRQNSGSFSPSFQGRIVQGITPASSFNTIQLPPLNWSPTPNELNDKMKVYTNERDDYKFDPTNPSQYVEVNPTADPEEQINLFYGYTPALVKEPLRRLNFGIFSWLTLARKDAVLCCLWNYLQTSVPKEVLKQRIWKTTDNQDPLAATDPDKKDDSTFVSEAEQEFKKKALTRDGDLDIRKYNDMEKEKLQQPVPQPKMGIKILGTPTSKSEMNKDGLPLGLTMFEGSIENELKLAEKIIAILPTQKVIWTLINKFFVYVYPFLPFFDEISFKFEMTRLIGPEDYLDVKIPKLNVEKRLDYAHVGIMLLMLRFSYLSLFSNKKEVNEFNLLNDDPSPKAQELKLLLSNPINIDVVDMAQLCINSFDLLRKPNITVLQLAYMMRLYNMFGPEEGDGADGGTSQITNGMLVQIAYSIGVNREPTNFEDPYDESTNNLIRKLWFFLVINDLIQGYQYGNPLVIDENSFDTRLPLYKPGSENIQDVRMERDVISTFAYFDKYYNKLKVLLKLTLNMREGTKMKELVALMSEFESFIHNTFGDISHYMTPFSQQKFNYSFMKTMKCKNYINLTTFVNSILNHLFLHFEKQQNHHLAFFYVRKMSAKMVAELMPCYLDLFGKNHVNFGELADLILSPSVLLMMHKTNHVNTALLIRINSIIYELKQDPQYNTKMIDDDYCQRFHKYCRLSKVLERIVKYCITSISKFSNRYYYAWRISKSHNFMFRLVINEAFYKATNFDNIPNFMKHMSNDQLDDLWNLFLVTWETISMKKRESVISKTIGIVKNTPVSDITSRVPSIGDTENPTVATSVSNYTPVTDLSDSDYNRFVNNKDIDRLWFQMISHKQDEAQDQHDTFAYDSTGVFSPPREYDFEFFTPSNPYLDSLGI